LDALFVSVTRLSAGPAPQDILHQVDLPSPSSTELARARTGRGSPSWTWWVRRCSRRTAWLARWFAWPSNLTWPLVIRCSRTGHTKVERHAKAPPFHPLA